MRRIRKAASHATGLSGTFSKKGKLPQNPPSTPGTIETEQNEAASYLPESLHSFKEASLRSVLGAESRLLEGPAPKDVISSDQHPTDNEQDAILTNTTTNNVPQSTNNNPTKHKAMGSKLLLLVVGVLLGMTIGRSLTTRSLKVRGLDRPDDRLAIQSLMKRYARAYDAKDWDMLRTVFADEATVNYEAVGGITGDVDDAVEYMTKHNGTKDRFGLFTFSQHFLTSSDVTFDGNRAVLEDKFFSPVGIKGFPVQTIFFVQGSYTHELVKVDGDWKSMYTEEGIAYKTLLVTLIVQCSFAAYFIYKAFSMIRAVFGKKGRVSYVNKAKSQ